MIAQKLYDVLSTSGRPMTRDELGELTRLPPDCVAQGLQRLRDVRVLATRRDEDRVWRYAAKPGSERPSDRRGRPPSR